MYDGFPLASVVKVRSPFDGAVISKRRERQTTASHFFDRASQIKGI